MSTVFLISDAAKKVKVEAHVLRYWEEELELPIKRNELGHRYYTEEDVKRFQEIKDLKERGLQLKAIRMVLKNGKLDMLPADTEARQQEEQNLGTKKADAEKPSGTAEKASAGEETGTEEGWHSPAAGMVEEEEPDYRLAHPGQQSLAEESREEKSARLQWLLQQLFKETLRENNEYLCREMKESILKELDYQFRMQEEREEERNAEKIKRDEEHFKKIDELLRKKRRMLKK